VKNGDQFGNYVVVDMLGAGASATVWRVRHALLQSNHALKVLSVENATLRGRLVQEGRIQAELVHPNIVRVTDVVDLGGPVGLHRLMLKKPRSRGVIERRRSLDALRAIRRPL